MWVSKWILACMITGEDIITDGLAAVTQRISDTSEYSVGKFGILDSEIINFTTFFKTPVTILLIIVTVYLILKCIKINRKTPMDTARILFPFFLTGLAPVAWYAFALNHSMEHFWFTNKACIVSVLGIMMGLVYLIRSNRQEGYLSGTDQY